MNETTLETDQVLFADTEPIQNSEVVETTVSEVVATVSDLNISDQLASIENTQRASLHVLLGIFFTITAIVISRLFGSFFKM